MLCCPQSPACWPIRHLASSAGPHSDVDTRSWLDAKPSAHHAHYRIESDLPHNSRQSITVNEGWGGGGGEGGEEGKRMEREERREEGVKRWMGEGKREKGWRGEGRRG